MRRGEATLGLRYFTDLDSSLVSEVLMEEALVVACSPAHRLAGRRLRDPAALARERWVTFPPPRRRREPSTTVLEQRLAAAGIEPGELVRIDSLTAQKRFVEGGSGSRCSSRAACRKSCGWARSRSSTRRRCAGVCR